MRHRLLPLLALAATVVAGCGTTPSAPTGPRPPEGLTSVVRQPPGRAAGTILVLHGGGWLRVGPAEVAYEQPEADRLTSYGWRTLNVDYRPGGASASPCSPGSAT